MGATGALVLALLKRRLSWDLVRQAAESTAKLSAFVVFILVGARVFSLTFYGVDGHRWVESFLVSLPGGQIGFLLFVNAFVFFLAFFLDFFELAFIVIPLIGPAADKLGIDLIWFGVMIGVNIQTSFMHPPFGFALFYLRGVAPKALVGDRGEGRRYIAVEAQNRRGILVHVTVERSDHVVSLWIRQPTGEQLIEDHCDRVHVCRRR